MRRSGRRSAPSRARWAARPRRCASGSATPSATRVSGLMPRARSVSGSRRWSARSASCGRPMRSCGKRRHILRWRSSTADRSHRRAASIRFVRKPVPEAPAGIAFIDDHRKAYGVEPICRVVRIAPSTYHARAAVRADPAKGSSRSRRDIELCAEIRRVQAANFGVYGVRKVGGSSAARASGPPAERWRG